MISSKDGICGGEPCFGTTRLPVRVVLELLRQGAPVSEILEQYDFLTEAEIKEAQDHSQ